MHKILNSYSYSAMFLLLLWPTVCCWTILYMAPDWKVSRKVFFLIQ